MYFNFLKLKIISVLIILLQLIPLDIFAVEVKVPWPCDRSYSVTQGNNNNYSHTGKAKYAFDFGMPEGQILTSVADGVVSIVREDSNTNCDPNTNYAGCTPGVQYANYLVINHANGISSLYMHLKYNSINVEVGDHVVTGQRVAQSGNTGKSTGPHLHFALQETCGSWWCQSVPASFIGVGVPIKYQTIASTCTCPEGYNNYGSCDGNTLKVCINGEATDKQCTTCQSNPSGTPDECIGEILSTGSITFLQPLDGETVDNPVVFESSVTGDIVKVKYTSDGWPVDNLGDSNDPYNTIHNFSDIGERVIVATGYDLNDNVVTTTSITINIIEAGEGSVEFLSPNNNTSIRNPVVATSSVSGDVAMVKYYADNRFLWGESSNSSNHYSAEKIFDTLGVRELNVRGYNSDGVRITGANDSITVTVLEQIVCDDECSYLRQKACDGSKIKECMNNADGCKVWGTSNSCGADRICQNNSCVETCQNECSTNGQRTCSGADVKECKNTDSDSCLELTTIDTCSNDETCENGQCIEINNCTDVCNNVGEKKCDANGNITECKVASNGCNIWTVPISCSATEICENGNCIEGENCDNECDSPGQRSCNNNYVEICGNYDTDSCLELKQITSCSNDETCVNGECEANINHECGPQGTKRCNTSDVESCELDGETLKWQVTQSCSGNQVCDGGECTDSCIDRCTFGVKQCNGNNVEICKTDIDSDICTEWGILKECTQRGETCESGYCTKTCWDECDTLGENFCNRDGNVYTCLESEETDCYVLRDPIYCLEGSTCIDGQCTKEDKPINTSDNDNVAEGCNYNSNPSNNYIFTLLFLGLFIIYRKRYTLKK